MKYRNDSFHLFKPLRRHSNTRLPSCRMLNECDEDKRDEGYVTAKDDIDLWEIVSKIQLTDLRTWETFGNSAPDKEVPFLTEAAPDVWSELDDLRKIQFSSFTGNDTSNNLITQQQFIKDMRNVLVGCVSHTFITNESGEIVLAPGISVRGVSNAALISYTKQMIFCGTCYKALNEMISVDLYTGKRKQEGYIFSELCESIRQYLSYYRVAALYLPDDSGLLEYHNYIRKLYSHLHMLASVCKVGPFVESEGIPYGVALLNYLYLKVLELSNRELINVLLSVLYPCLQVYFNRFLKQWIVDGSVEDPYNEFFITTTNKYLATKGRTYWTRSYTVRFDIVPEFLTNLHVEILNCGRAMNLLKLCNAKSSMCVYLSGKKPNLLQCCITEDQLKSLESTVRSYYLEVLSDSGRFSIEHFIRKSQEQEVIFLNLVALKRTATLKRIETEKLKKLEEIGAKKRAECEKLREEYETAIKEHERKKAEELEREVKFNEEQERVRQLEDRIIKEEALRMIKYYDDLFKKSEERKNFVQSNMDKMKRIHLDLDVGRREQVELRERIESRERIEQFEQLESTSSNDTFVTTCESVEGSTSAASFEAAKPVHTSKSLDVMNANVETEEDQSEDNFKGTRSLDNFQQARLNKLKVMGTEFGLYDYETRPAIDIKDVTLTDAQRNKLKVMGTELGNFGGKNEWKITSTEYGACDNENFLNQNLIEDTARDSMYILPPRVDLKLDLNKIPYSRSNSSISSFIKSPNFEFKRPLSLVSTPMESSTLSKMETATTAASNFEGFAYPTPVTRSSTKMSKEEAKKISTGLLSYFMQQSISISVLAQNNLAQNELLRYFFKELKYLEHLNALRNYFFLLDGEFCRNITEGIFDRLYENDAPLNLINYRTLNQLLYTALDSTCRTSDSSKCLSFKINVTPKGLSVRDVAVLDCLSLSYKVGWPLNILLPTDTIGKYDEVFKFLLKLHWVSWVLKNIFMKLKLLCKEVGKREGFLILSPQYQKMQQCRHVMTQFVQTLQNYFISEVLQTSWTHFEDELIKSKNLDQLYAHHTTYIKNILFLCMLNQKSSPIRNILHNIFLIVLKFYDYLRGRKWIYTDGEYTHPNFGKLEGIFENFMDFVRCFFNSCRKIARSGYQPQLIQLITMLDANEFYSKQNLIQI